MREHLNIKSDLNALDGIRPRVDAFIGTRLDALDKNRVILAVDEALANIIEHAYAGDRTRGIELTMERGDGEIVFTIEDEGAPFDPTAERERELDLERHAQNGRARGLGIYLFTTLMQARHETRPGGGNRLILSRPLPAEASEN